VVGQKETTMQCAEIMKTQVECIAGNDTVAAAAARMRAQNIGFLPVCDPAGAMIGTLTDRDIAIRLVAGDRPGRTPVEEVMTRETICCRPGDELDEAEALMAMHQKSRIVCVDETQHPVGVISLSDIARHEPSGERASQVLREVSGREVRV
jgi:CBS domain-containing protein